MIIQSRRKKWNNNYLNPLVGFLSSQSPDGITLQDLSVKLGVSPKRVSAIFLSDDISLSKAESLVATYGFQLKMKYVSKHTDATNDVVLDPQYPNAGNLTPLLQTFRSMGLSFSSVAIVVGCDPSVIKRAFLTGNIMVRQLYQIASALDISVEWCFVDLRSCSKIIDSL